MKLQTNQQCSIEGCDRPKRADELCHAHWRRRWRGCTDTSPIGPVGIRVGKELRFPGSSRRARNIWHGIELRCSTYPKMRQFKNYGGKGIRNFLTPYDIEFLWNRDGAARMKKPSIDRENSSGDYTLENCRFMELSENVKRGWAERRSKMRIGIPSKEKAA